MKRPRGALEPRTWMLVVTTVMVFGLTACTPTPIRVPARGKVHPVGRILGIITGSHPGLLEFVFSPGTRRALMTPGPAQSAFLWGVPPVEYAFLVGPSGRLRLFGATNAGRFRPVAASLSPEVQPAGLPAGDLLAAASCQGQERVFVLNLRAVATPKEVARGCPAALSPGGEFVAFSPDLSSVWKVPSDGTGHSEPMVRLVGRRLLLSLGIRSPRILPQAGMSWGRNGLAVAVGGEGRFACLLVNPAGKLRVIPLGAARPSELAWSPTGRLLAFIEHDRIGVALRVFDAVSHRLRLAALALGKGLRGLVWSPNSEALVTLEGTDHWLVVSPDGATVRSIAVPPGSIPTDWVA